MARITIESDQKIQSINIVFAEDGAGDVQVTQTGNSTPTRVRPEPEYPVTYPEDRAELPEIEASDFEEMDDLPENGQPLEEAVPDNRKTVGESFADVSFDVPEMSQTASPSAIEIPDIENRPQKVDEGMGAEL